MAKRLPNAVPTGELVLTDKTLVKWLNQKDELVKEGRAVSKKLDAVEQDIAKLSDEERALTGKVEPKELIERGNKLRDEINTLVKELEQVSKDIYEEKMKAIPEDMKTKHFALNDEKEKLERERNKIALKVQKLKDRIIPKLKKLTVGFLGEFEDLLTAELSGDKAIVKKFSHLEDWKVQWKYARSKDKGDE